MFSCFIQNKLLNQRFQSGIVLLMLIVISGCGEAGPERVAVSGTVNFDGQPMTNAVISFSPDGALKGPRASARIIDGKYQIKEKHGPLIGKMKVEIRSEGLEEAEFQEIVRKGEKPVVMKVKIPKYFNEETELRAETKAGEDNIIDYDLKTKE